MNFDLFNFIIILSYYLHFIILLFLNQVHGACNCSFKWEMIEYHTYATLPLCTLKRPRALYIPILFYGSLSLSLTVCLSLSLFPSLSISRSHCYVVCSFSHAQVASLFGRGSLCAAWIGGSDPIHRQLSVGNWNACALCWGRRQLPNRKKLLKSDRKIKSNKYVR